MKKLTVILSFVVGTIMGAAFVAPTVAQAAEESWNRWKLFVRLPAVIGGKESGRPETLGQLTVESDLATRKVMVGKGYTSQSADYLQFVDSANSEVFSIDSAGAMVVTGSITSDALANLKAVHLTEGYTADPCAGTGFTGNAGILFWNATNNYLCACANTDEDVDVKDGTACF